MENNQDVMRLKQLMDEGMDVMSMSDRTQLTVLDDKLNFVFELNCIHGNLDWAPGNQPCGEE